MQRQLDEALDLHVISQIDAARPDSGSEGVTTIEILRFAVGAMRAKGVNPTIVAMNPDDSTDLDLTTAGADNLPLFSLRTTGDSSPLWGLRVVEAKNVDAGSAYLIDPQVLGVLYTGSTSFLADPYTGMANNTINFRLELNALMHIRNADGAYIAVLNNS